jgi:hypothetical protein
MKRTCTALSLILLAACDSGPAAPEKGTPGFYWSAARQTLQQGDYLKTVDHLNGVLKTQNEYTAKALAWQVLLTSGMTNGYAEIADSYEFGARANKANPAPFRKQVNDNRTMASRMALAFAEAAARTDKDLPGDKVTLDFPFPVGSTAAVPQLGQVSSGIYPSESEYVIAQKKALERGVLQAITAASGSADASSAFFCVLAQGLYNASQVYSPKKMDEPQKMTALAERAASVLKSVPESKESKDLAKKIQETLKKKAA